MSPPSLLLLPSSPHPPTRAAFAAAYREPLAAVLSRLQADLAEPSADGPPTLVIALACPLLAGPPVPRSRTLRWHRAQSLLAAIYTLLAAVCADLAIPSDASDPEAVDARVLLVHHQPGSSYTPGPGGEFPPNCTAVLDLPAFASAVHPWRAVFHPSSEPGYKLLSAYLRYAEGRTSFRQNQFVAVPGGVSLFLAEPGTPADAEAEDDEEPLSGYPATILGGTFDHLHPGHKLLLHATALLLRIPPADTGTTAPAVLHVGISGDDLLRNKKYAAELEPWPRRAAAVVSFLATLLEPSFARASLQTSAPRDGELHARMRGGAVDVRCVTILDAYGPTITEPNIDAIAVSVETRGGGRAVNDRRGEKGWHLLDVYEVDVLDAGGVDGGATRAQDFAAKISSTAIRQQKAEARSQSR